MGKQPSAADRCTAFRARERHSGQSLVEFALLLPLLLMLALGTLDFGRAMYAYVTVSNAAQAGAEYASRNPTSDLAAVRRAVMNESVGFLAATVPSDLVVTKAALTGGAVTMMQVTVTYTFRPVSGQVFPFLAPMSISAHAAAPASAL